MNTKDDDELESVLVELALASVENVVNMFRGGKPPKSLPEIDEAKQAIHAKYISREECERRVLEARELIEKKYKTLEHGIFAIDYYINKPYPDDERWTPYTRFIHPRMIMVRKALQGEDVGEMWAMQESQRLAQLKPTNTNAKAESEES